MRPHKHFLLDATIAKAPTDEEAMKEFLRNLIVDIGMVVAKLSKDQNNPIAWYCDEEGNEGMTASGILTTSHVVFHVWDRVDTAEIHFDLYSCSDFKVNHIVSLLNEQFGLIEGKGHVINRRGNQIDYVMVNNSELAFYEMQILEDTFSKIER